MSKKEKQYRRSELMLLETIEQAWDGDELKIDEGDYKVWLTNRENVAFNGDYTVETFDEKRGVWEQKACYF